MKKLFQCEACKEIYESEGEAVRCERDAPGDPVFAVGTRVGPYEVRSRRIGRHKDRHTWLYEARRSSGGEGLYRYREFTEEGIRALLEDSRASRRA
jgi:hypothetical protein